MVGEREREKYINRIDYSVAYRLRRRLVPCRRPGDAGYVGGTRHIKVRSKYIFFFYFQHLYLRVAAHLQKKVHSTVTQKKNVSLNLLRGPLKKENACLVQNFEIY